MSPKNRLQLVQRVTDEKEGQQARRLAQSRARVEQCEAKLKELARASIDTNANNFFIAFSFKGSYELLLYKTHRAASSCVFFTKQETLIPG